MRCSETLIPSVPPPVDWYGYLHYSLRDRFSYLASSSVRLCGYFAMYISFFFYILPENGGNKEGGEKIEKKRKKKKAVTGPIFYAFLPHRKPKKKTHHFVTKSQHLPNIILVEVFQIPNDHFKCFLLQMFFPLLPRLSREIVRLIHQKAEASGRCGSDASKQTWHTSFPRLRGILETLNTVGVWRKGLQTIFNMTSQMSGILSLRQVFLSVHLYAVGIPTSC